MPLRIVPFVYNEPHEVHPDHDIDWTLCPENRQIELERRWTRNEMLREELQAGNRVVYRSSGWSLWPRVHSGDNTYYGPVTSDEDVNEGDIVFCQVWGRYFAHLVKTKKECGKPEWPESVYTISRLDGAENGDCKIDTIYGRLIAAWH